MAPPQSRAPVKALREPGEEAPTMLQSSVPLNWDVEHPLSWDPEGEICSWNKARPEKGPTTYSLEDPTDPDKPKGKMIENSIPFSWDASKEICSWNQEENTNDNSKKTTKSLDPEGELGYKKDMIKHGIPLSWDVDKPLSWLDQAPKEATRALRDEGEEAPVMVQPGSIPFSWDPNHPLRYSPTARSSGNLAMLKRNRTDSGLTVGIQRQLLGSRVDLSD